MLDVYICEDIEDQRKRLEKLIENNIIMKEYYMKIRLSTADPEEVLKSVQERKNRGVYFLDIDLRVDMTGLELAENIRKYDTRGYIIFVTTHSEMLELTFEYKVEAYDFMVKEDFEKIPQKISDCLESIAEREFTDNINENKIFVFKQGGCVIQEDLVDIISFEIFSNFHNVLMTSTEKQIQFYGSLREVESQLDKRFVRCSDSVIVNADRITNIKKKDRVVCMDNGDEYVASVRRLRNLC